MLERSYAPRERFLHNIFEQQKKGIYSLTNHTIADALNRQPVQELSNIPTILLKDSPQNLLQRLNQITIDPSQNYDRSTIEKVRNMIEYEINNPNKGKPYKKTFDNIDCYLLYYKLHTAWQDLSISEMQDNINTSAGFHGALVRFINSTTENKSVRKQQLGQIYSYKRQTRGYTDFGALKAEFNSHPEWQEKSIADIRNDISGGGHAFYIAAKRFISKSTNAKNERRMMMQELITEYKKKRWTFRTFDEWRSEFEKHPEWINKTAIEMREDDKSGASIFYTAYKKWVAKNFKDPEVAEKYRNEFVVKKPPRTRKNILQTIEDWENEYTKVKWSTDLPFTVFRKDKLHGGQSFYGSFLKWLNSQPINGNEKAKMMKRIFPTKENVDRRFYTGLNDWLMEYHNHPEWKNKSAREMSLDKDTGASAFYAALLVWAKKNYSSEIERKKILQEFLKNKETKLNTFTLIKNSKTEGSKTTENEFPDEATIFSLRELNELED